MAFADKSTFIPVEALEGFGNHPAELQIDIDDYFMGTQTNSETRRAQESTEQMELSKASLEETFKEKVVFCQLSLTVSSQSFNAFCFHYTFLLFLPPQPTLLSF